MPKPGFFQGGFQLFWSERPAGVERLFTMYGLEGELMLGNWRTFLSAFVLLFLGSLASGQLLVGYDESAASGASQAWDVNPNDASSTVLWGGGVDVWGMAYDADTKTVYVNSGTTLYGGELGLGSPPLLGTVTDVAGANISLVGLTWANGGLYGTRNVGDEALYAIDLNTFVATVFLDYAEADYDLVDWPITLMMDSSTAQMTMPRPMVLASILSMPLVAARFLS